MTAMRDIVVFIRSRGGNMIVLSPRGVPMSIHGIMCLIMVKIVMGVKPNEPYLWSRPVDWSSKMSEKGVLAPL